MAAYKTDWKVGDVCWIHGVTDARTNLACRGKVYHIFQGHGYPHYVIAVDILDGEFEVRTVGCMWETERTYAK